jgi:antitoxin VapB
MACITDQQQVNAVTLHLSGLYTDFVFDLQLVMSISTALTHNDSQAIHLPADVLKVEVHALGVERTISPEGHSWDQFFKAGPAVSDDFWAERASQTQAERDDL